MTGKRVVVLASGETERRALPTLLRHLVSEDISLQDVRIPQRSRHLTVEMAVKLIRAVWFEAPASRPEKYVVLLDADGSDPEAVLRPYREGLPPRIADIEAAVQFACAQWHLEAWYFADSTAARAYLGGALGSVDCSQPDHIVNPKLHLEHLLGARAYTAAVSAEIASKLDPRVVADRSPSFRGLLAAMRNGPAEPVA